MGHLSLHIDLIIQYKGKCKTHEIFSCQICGKQSREHFVANPSTGLVDWYELKCCKKCTQREIGSKNKKKLKAIMETANGKTK